VDVLLCGGTPGKYLLDTTPWRPFFSRFFRLNWTDDSQCAEEWQRLLSAVEQQIVGGLRAGSIVWMTFREAGSQQEFW
jgi:hypothetical protein